MTNNVNDSKNTKLTKDELYNLIDKAQNGDQDAMQDLIKSHIGLIISIVKKLNVNTSGLSTEDLISEATCEFISSVHKFDMTKDCLLSTYVTPRIEYALKSYAADQNYTLSFPEKPYREITKYNAFRNRYYTEYGCEPSDEEILSELKWDRKKLESTRANAPSGYSSFDGNSNEDDDNHKSISNLVPATDNRYQEERYSIWDKQVVPQLFALLSDIEREVIRIRFYEDRVDSNGKEITPTFKEIADEIGSTEAIVRRANNSALDKMRNFNFEDYGFDRVA